MPRGRCSTWNGRVKSSRRPRAAVSRGTISTLDLGAPAGQDRRRAAESRKSYLMRIRRRDKDPAETDGSEEPTVVPYDYDQEPVASGGPGHEPDRRTGSPSPGADPPTEPAPPATQSGARGAPRRRPAGPEHRPAPLAAEPTVSTDTAPSSCRGSRPRRHPRPGPRRRPSSRSPRPWLRRPRSTPCGHPPSGTRPPGCSTARSPRHGSFPGSSPSPTRRAASARPRPRSTWGRPWPSWTTGYW